MAGGGESMSISMGFWSEIWEEVKAEPWGVPACPKSDDFLYFR